MRDRWNGDEAEAVPGECDFSVCIIVGDCGIRSLRANLRNMEEKAELLKEEKADRSMEKGEARKNSKKEVKLLGISQSRKDTRQSKKEKGLHLDQLELRG